MKDDGGKSWISISILVLIVTFGACLRVHNIDKQNLWLDEYWALYLATGRGDSVFQLPANQILQRPPPIGFGGAPPWWHIWNGIDTTSHPPLYHIALRSWVDALGDSDRSIRLMSTCFSLGCIVLLYAAVRMFGGGTSQGLIAASLMAFAPVQILYSQQARPYSMIQFIALATALLLISVEKRGRTWIKLWAITLVVIALALTHYFSAGVIAGLAVYGLMRFRGRNRLAVLSAILLGGAISATAWGSHLRDLSTAGLGMIFHRHLLHSLLSVPQRLTWESNVHPMFAVDDASWAPVIALALVAYLLPLFSLRRYPQLLFWWLWTMGTIGLVLVIDIHRQSALLSIIRYAIPAAPALYAIFAVPLPSRLGQWSPWLILAGVLFFAVGYWQTGPADTPNFTLVSQLIKRDVTPEDVLIVTGRHFLPKVDESPIIYFVIQHYVGSLDRPIVFGDSAISDPVRLQLRRYRRVWVVGASPDADTQNILPGWQTHDIQGSRNGERLWYVTPATSGNS